MDAAKLAGQRQALALLDAQVPLTATAEALERLKGSASAIQTTLVNLGMSADVASQKVGEKLNVAIGQLGSQMTQSLTDEIAALDGKDYLAAFRDLIESVDTMMTDASSINVDTSLVGTFFGKQAQAMVDESQLTGDAFAELIAAFPRLSGVVHGFVEDVTRTADDLTSAMQDYQDRRFAADSDGGIGSELVAFDRDAQRQREEEAKSGNGAIADLERALGAERAAIVRSYSDTLNERFFTATDADTAGSRLAAFERKASAERAAAFGAGAAVMVQLERTLAVERIGVLKNNVLEAYQAESTALNDTISKLDSFTSSIKTFREGLLTSDLSTLSPKDQYLEAQKRFRAVSALAATGDENAIGELQGVTQTYLDEAKSYYASSEDYFAAFDETQRILRSTETKAQSDLDIARAQLAKMDAQLAALGVIDEGVQSLVDAIKALTDAMSGLAGGPAVPGGISAVDSAALANAFEPTNFIKSSYATLLGRNPAAAEIDAWLATGRDPIGITEGILGSPEYLARKAAGYASGGLVMGEGTGTSDSIRAMLSNGEFVMPAASVTPATLPVLEAMRSGRSASGNDNGSAALIEEVRALRTEVGLLRATVASSDEATRAELRAGNKSGSRLARVAERRGAA